MYINCIYLYIYVYKYMYVYIYVYINIYIYTWCFIYLVHVGPAASLLSQLRRPLVQFGPGHGQGDPGALADVTTHGKHILMVCIRTLQYTTLSTLH